MWAKPERPTPKISRPWLSWSTVATSSASRSGWQSGSTWTAVPIFMRSVRWAMVAAIIIGDDSTERSGAKCSSASHMASRPHSSAASTWASELAKDCAAVSPGSA